MAGKTTKATPERGAAGFGNVLCGRVDSYTGIMESSGGNRGGADAWRLQLHFEQTSFEVQAPKARRQTRRPVEPVLHQEHAGDD